MNNIYTFTVSFLFLIIVTGFSYADNNFVVSIGSNSSVGTAFYIGEGKFVTNFHVLNRVRVEFGEHISYTINILDNNEDIMVQKILHLDAKNDLAIVQVDRAYIKTIEQTLQPAKLSTNPHLVKSKDYKIISIWYNKYNDYEKVRPTLSSSSLTLDSQSKYIVFNTFMEPGMSGSPVLNKDDQIIGVVCCINKTVGYAIPIFKVINLLKQASLECTLFSECLKQGKQQLKQQAEDGDLDAQYELGLLYLLGDPDIKQDVQLAVKLFQELAKKNDMYAQTSLGLLYINNDRGINKDLALASYWLSKAISNGNLDPHVLSGYIYIQSQIGEPRTIILKRLTKIATKGVRKDAKNMLGSFYLSED